MCDLAAYTFNWKKCADIELERVVGVSNYHDRGLRNHLAMSIAELPLIVPIMQLVNFHAGIERDVRVLDIAAEVRIAFSHRPDQQLDREQTGEQVIGDIAEAFVRVLLADSSHYPVYNSGGHAINLGDLADMVKEFLPESQITFDNEGGRELSGNYMVDNSRLRDEFEIEYAPFRQRVLEIINEVRVESGLPVVTGR